MNKYHVEYNGKKQGLYSWELWRDHVCLDCFVTRYSAYECLEFMLSKFKMNVVSLRY